MTQSAKIRCGYCGRSLSPTSSGMVRRHGKCPGSGHAPLFLADRPLAVVRAECCAFMAQLAERSVDHVFADPPYSEKTHTTVRRGGPDGHMDGMARVTDLGFAHWTRADRMAAAREFKRIVRRWVLVFTDDLGLISWMDALTYHGLEYIRTGVWRKVGSTPQFTGDRPAQSVEFIVIAHQTHPSGKPMKKAWNGRGRHAFWEVPIVLDRGHNGARLHTTQKPVELMRALVRDFTDPGDLILDPCAGSGTTLVAAGQMGRAAVGIEDNQEHASTAQRRVSRVRQQLTLIR